MYFGTSALAPCVQHTPALWANLVHPSALQTILPRIFSTDVRLFLFPPQELDGVTAEFGPHSSLIERPFLLCPLAVAAAADSSSISSFMAASREERRFVVLLLSLLLSFVIMAADDDDVIVDGAAAVVALRFCAVILLL